MPPNSLNNSSNNAPKSPFFQPSSTPHQVVQVQTPGGTKRKTRQQIHEHKSTRLGCTANLMNAIIGSGIVGIPYALKNAGFVAGILLIILCALLTDKSLRLLIATAKHAQVPSYETLAEAAFGKWGFGFISANMFIMAYGAMLSYLMIVKDTFSVAFGVDPDNFPVKRILLLVISLLVIVPLSSQRDMADLAITSRISVIIDALLVLVVAFKSPVSVDRLDVMIHDTDWLQTDFWIHTETIFVGLGVLSFAFVCQHSAFIIAGSLENPTIARWSQVTKAALLICGSLALLCGITGYLGFLDNTLGNILNNLPTENVMSNVARMFLGTTMLFVYPMESFVARHVLVVFLFEGRRAHEGEDASILARRDRRIALTFALYLTAVLPALLFEDLGQVLAATGAVGGSCLSYIGPGAIYLGIHGDQFLELIRHGNWWQRFVHDEDIRGIHTITTTKNTTSLNNQQQTLPTETTSLMQVSTGASTESTSHSPDDDDATPCFVTALQAFSWYILLMPVWCWIAKFGETVLAKHREDMALKSPHPLRIGNVAPNTPEPLRQSFDTAADHRQKEESLSRSWRGEDAVTRAGSFRGLAGDGSFAGSLAAGAKPPYVVESSSLRPYHTSTSTGSSGSGTTKQAGTKSPSLNQQIGAKLLERQKQNNQQAIEKDPQKAAPTVFDFLLAVFLILFGLMALFAGLVSIGIQAEQGGG